MRALSIAAAILLCGTAASADAPVADVPENPPVGDAPVSSPVADVPAGEPAPLEPPPPLGVRQAVREQAETDPDIAEAIRLRRAYMFAVYSEDFESARALWHPAERDRYRMLDWSLGYRTWFDSVQSMVDSVLAVKKSGDHMVMTVRWTFRSTGKVGGDDEWHLLRTDDGWAPINVIGVETRGWSEKRGGRIVYHWQGADRFDTDLMLDNETRVEAAARALAVELPERLDYYLCSSRDQVGALFALQPSTMRAHEVNGVVAAVTPYAVHGFGRVFFFEGFPEPSSGNPFSNAGGGIAFALLGGVRARPAWLFARAREMLHEDGLPKLEQSFLKLDADETTPYAPHLAAVTDYMLRTFGPDTFFDFGWRARHWLGVERGVRAAFGVEWSDLEFEVASDIERRDMPWIRTIDPFASATDVEPLVRITDERGDASGVMGTPQPPNAVAAAVFDLTGFTATRLDDALRLEVELASPPPAGSEWGFEDVMVRILISTGALAGAPGIDAGGGTPLGVVPGFQRLVEVSPDGVLVQSWRGEWLSGRHRRLSSDAPLFDGNRLAIDIPIELIGEPRDDWTYQVLISGHAPAASLAQGVGRATAWDVHGALTGAGQPGVFDALGDTSPRAAGGVNVHMVR